jgi:hypothetical protein
MWWYIKHTMGFRGWKYGVVSMLLIFGDEERYVSVHCYSCVHCCALKPFLQSTLWKARMGACTGHCWHCYIIQEMLHYKSAWLHKRRYVAGKFWACLLWFKKRLRLFSFRIDKLVKGDIFCAVTFYFLFIKPILRNVIPVVYNLSRPICVE